MHIYRHLFDEGIGLRQLLDYYFVLRSLHIEQESMGDHTQSMGMWAESIGRGVSSNTEIMHTLGRFGMRKFAGEKTKHNLRLLPHYPEEVLWEPVFRLYHWLWRRYEWWKTPICILIMGFLPADLHISEIICIFARKKLSIIQR